MKRVQEGEMQAVVRWWNTLFAPKDWEPYARAGKALVMRRWRKGAWEYREPTEDEVREDLYWQAIK
jgi:hypothetical protein